MYTVNSHIDNLKNKTKENILFDYREKFEIITQVVEMYPLLNIILSIVSN